MYINYSPRYGAAFSAGSAVCSGKVEFVFNVVDITAEDGRMFARQGLCTGTAC